MELDEIMALLKANTAVTPRRFYKYVAEKKTGTCAKCLRLAGEIFSKNDPNIPQLPLHPNCNCKLIEVDQAEYQKQQEFKFGNMSHEERDNQSDDKKYLWCNRFRKHFGEAIDKYSQQYNIPKQLLAAIIANEMLDWKFPDGTWLDGITGGGIGYAQIAIKTAKQHGFYGTDNEIRKKLESYSGSVEIAAKILQNYLTEFKECAKNNKLGPGFEKIRLVYRSKDKYIRQEGFGQYKFQRLACFVNVCNLEQWN